MTKDDLDDEATKTTDELASMAENAGRYARKMIDETEHLGDGAEAFLDLIREKPIQSAMIALGVGAVIGLLLRGK